MVNYELMIINKESIRKALFEWESMARRGEGFLSHEEAAKMPIEENVDLSTGLLWSLLNKQFEQLPNKIAGAG